MLKKLLTGLKSSLQKTKSYLGGGIASVFLHKKLDDASLAEFEDLLLCTDMGADATSAIIKNVASLKFKKDASVADVKQKVAQTINAILQGVEKPFSYIQKKPQVVILCGVNGNGKTTTIGKLAHKFIKDGKSVMIAACDTFRAAAKEQLELWANRSCAKFYSGNSADPASVAYKALKKCQEDGIDILLVDTAGRLHTQKNLMDELKKISSVVQKIENDAPHSTMLVLDATVGQNALSQIKIFKEAINVNGLVITKLDGTAKGGIVIAIAKNYPDISINFIGTGEAIEDIEDFSAERFTENLLDM